jgi:hypothetical protein
MPLNKKKALREIDEVRHWDGPSSQVETFAIIALETIRRWSPPNSTYVEKAEQKAGLLMKARSSSYPGPGP